jgi:hypothetical protein
MNDNNRRFFSPEQKVGILREHLVDGKDLLFFYTGFFQSGPSACSAITTALNHSGTIHSAQSRSARL